MPKRRRKMFHPQHREHDDGPCGDTHGPPRHPRPNRVQSHPCHSDGYAQRRPQLGLGRPRSDLASVVRGGWRRREETTRDRVAMARGGRSLGFTSVGWWGFSASAGISFAVAAPKTGGGGASGQHRRRSAGAATSRARGAATAPDRGAGRHQRRMPLRQPWTRRPRRRASKSRVGGT